MKTLFRLQWTSILFIFANCTQPAFTQELSFNGDFESFVDGIPTGWNYVHDDGPGPLQSSAQSPFGNIYPSGSSSILLQDGLSFGPFPLLTQNFGSQYNQLTFSWDFRLDALNGQPWLAALVGNNGSSVVISIDGNNHDLTIPHAIGSPSHLIDLVAGQWYQVQAVVDLPTQSVGVNVTPFLGQRLGFGPFPLDVPTASISRVDFGDSGDSTMNAPMNIDNVSITPVPEPSAMVLASLAALLTILYRTSRSGYRLKCMAMQGTEGKTTSVRVRRAS